MVFWGSLAVLAASAREARASGGIVLVLFSDCNNLRLNLNRSC